jgi:nitronate monooxygenase
MNFGSGGNSKAKAWKDIWGSGQGIGSVKKVAPVANMVARFEREYRDAQHALGSATVPFAQRQLAEAS